MDVVRAALIIIGIIGLALEGFKITFARISPGWLGAALIAVAVLISVSVK